MKFLLTGIALISFANFSALAQQVVTIAPMSDGNVLRAGTPIPLRLTEILTTKGKDLKVGHRFNLEVAESIVLNGTTVIPSGTPAIGEVTDVKNKGMWGKSGKIVARVLHLRIAGRQVRLTGQFDDKGKSGTAGVVGAVVFLPVAGFFVTGKSADLPAGTNVRGFLDEDLAFNIGPVQPIAVPSAPR